MDMYQAMKAFMAAGYDGSMHLDHTPTFVGDYALGGLWAIIGPVFGFRNYKIFI